MTSQHDRIVLGNLLIKALHQHHAELTELALIYCRDEPTDEEKRQHNIQCQAVKKIFKQWKLHLPTIVTFEMPERNIFKLAVREKQRQNFRNHKRVNV